MARSRRTDDVDAPRTPARSDAYVGLLMISLLAQIAGAVFFYLDYSQYDGKPKLPPVATVPAGGGAPAPAPAQGGGPAGMPK